MAPAKNRSAIIIILRSIKRARSRLAWNFNKKINSPQELTPRGMLNRVDGGRVWTTLFEAEEVDETERLFKLALSRVLC